MDHIFTRNEKKRKPSTNDWESVTITKKENIQSLGDILNFAIELLEYKVNLNACTVFKDNKIERKREKNQTFTISTRKWPFEFERIKWIINLKLSY